MSMTASSTYAILSNAQAQIEGGRWPFSGGTLELLPAILNFAADQPRKAHVPRHRARCRCVRQSDGTSKNVAATGTLDGLFPMIFDERGGRIEGGLLVGRQVGLPPLILTNTATDSISPLQ